MENCNLKTYTDKQIVESILQGNNTVTSAFFCNNCRGLFYYIHSQICNYRYEPDEIANEIYLYLAEKNWYKLRLFDYRSKLITWLSVVAIRYYRKKITGVIDSQPIETLYNQQSQSGLSIEALESHIDIHESLKRMPNKRYQMVVEKLDLQEIEPEKLAQEMKITTANLYNIHRRALQQLKSVMQGKEVIYG